MQSPGGKTGTATRQEDGHSNQVVTGPCQPRSKRETYWSCANTIDAQASIAAAAALLAASTVQAAAGQETQDQSQDEDQSQDQDQAVPEAVVPKLQFVTDTQRHITVHIEGETTTVMKLLQTTLLQNPMVVFASLDVPDQVDFAVLDVRMASTGEVSAKAAVVKALAQMRLQCRAFASACRLNVPDFV